MGGSGWLMGLNSCTCLCTSLSRRVSGLIVRGIFLATPKEIHWFYQEGASRVYPDYWQDFIKPIPEDEQNDLLQAYHQRLTGGNEIARMRVAKAWSLWEARTATLLPSSAVLEHFSEPHTALSVARIEAHYFVNNSFLKENELLKNASILKDIPGYIIHGRYDMICPLEQAYNLHKEWGNADFFVVQGAGHSAGEPGITAALIEASDGMLKKLGK